MKNKQDNFRKPSQKKPFHHGRWRFRNLPNPDLTHGTRREYVSFLRKMLTFQNERVDIPEGHVIPQDLAAEHMHKHLNSDQDSLTWLGQACFLIKIDGITILTDPYLTDFASPTPFAGPKRFVASGINLKDLPSIDYLLLSHNHYDHLDSKTIHQMKERRDMTIVTPLKLGSYFKRRGFKKVVEMDWWDSLNANGVAVHALPSQHWSKRTLLDRNKSLWASFSIHGKNNKLYFAGDTGYAPLFKDIGKEYGPFDYALVGIGAYEPQILMKPHHTTPEEAVKIGEDVRSRTLVAMHWGTVRLTLEPLFEPPGRFTQAAAKAGYDETQSWVMSIGESRPLI
ncbi:MBL fold metallo-hydrolase [Sneathiella aquimaris]|uniref:MBL fold metallo-hydrolase n=1 Tax=Sneathiella aquimaris TaxID=2599305 RepID=UPI00146B4BC7|nr:MBL fold metallo-hydrolase [Sneathiella aquimaris]